jgi:ABC-type phosphate/phosphonate transport system substrate-binding protein
MAVPEALLPMYALPEMAAANNALWAALRQEVPGLPAHLSPAPSHLPTRIDPTTIFSQMCGYPLKTLFAGQFFLLGTPLYDFPGCAMAPDGMPTHRSFIITASTAPFASIADLRHKIFAVNGHDSNSGMNLPRRMFAEVAGGAKFFFHVTITGSHLASMAAVARGGADAAAIDCVTYGFCAEYRPQLTAQLRILAETPASPAIPFMSSLATPPETVAALTRALQSPSLANALRGLHITAILPPRPEAYDLVQNYEAEAAALGYPTLA